jgi:parallel beta-helix repeat protein
MRAYYIRLIALLVSVVSLSCTADLGPTLSPVASLTIEPANPTIQVGSAAQLSSIARDSFGAVLPERPVTWKMSSTRTAIVGPSGIVYGVTAGVATVFATVGVTIASSPITVSPTPLESKPTFEAVVLYPESITMPTGSGQQFAATARMTNGNTKPVNVTYSATGGTITSGGFYTAGSLAGSYRIIATQTGGTLADTSAVTITPPTPTPPTLVAVVLTPASVTLQSGATQQLAASGQMSDGSTSAVNVMYTATGGTITSGGLYTAGGVAGSYRIIATQTGGTLADTSAMTITPPNPTPPTLVAVVLAPASTTLQSGATQQFAASGQMSDGSTSAVNVTYNPTGGTITSGGFYTAGSVAGSYRIIATQTGGTLADTSAVTITPPNPTPPTLVAVVLTPASVAMQSGATQQYAASGQMSDGSTSAVNVTYSATGGTITSGGFYTAGSVAGSYRIIATQTGGTLADTSAVTITLPPPTLVAVVLTPASTTLRTGATQQFAASGQMSDGSTSAVNVTYNATGGTITSGGFYTAGSVAGSYRIIATQTGGTLADTSAVTITLPPPTLVAVVLTPASVALQSGATQQFAASGRMSDGSTSAVNVTYNATGGTITSGGFYTAGSVAGSYRIIATQTGGTLADTSAMTITAPGPCVGSATVICPGESIQAKVNAAPTGTTFTIKAGIHRSQRVNPKSGDIFAGEPGAILDGEGVTQFAFEGGAVGVQLRNLEIRNYTTLCPDVNSCLGAIQGYNAVDWVLENLNVHHNAGSGANVHGRVTVRGGSYHHNARLGIGVNAGAGALIEGVDLSYNNPDRLFDPLWEAGGIKVAAGGNNVTVRGCHAHHNVGPGIWFDIDNRGSVVQDNLATDNAYVGIFYEISYAGVILGNTVTGNGTATTGPYGAGILISESGDVEVHHNVVRGNADGIVGLQTNRGSGLYGPYLITNLWVHDNDVKVTTGSSGLLDLIGDGSLYNRNNRFTLNTYDITGNSLPFSINGLVRVSRSTWQARGLDLNSTFTGP